MHLLIVDDDSVSRMTLRTALTSDGHTVSLASDGEDALAMLAECNADLVISDLKMPRVGGIALRNLTRELPGKTKLPFLFISGYEDGEIRNAVLNKSLEGFFRKGRPLSELLAWVKYLTTPASKRSIYSPDVQGPPEWAKRSQSYRRNLRTDFN